VELRHLRKMETKRSVRIVREGEGAKAKYRIAA
jgi:hypothetical protein